uniref:Protein TOPLESS n=1 Tax=Rhizophora mucronata TaxID=61149 RepID=A0A2P2MWW1_RHIMU
MSVRNLEFFRLGNCNLSRNNGFASISFLSSTNIIALADFVSPYLDSCSFSLKFSNVSN